MELKLLQCHNKCDLNFLILRDFYNLKFNTDSETTIGDKLLYTKKAATVFENDFISKCFYCGCIKNKSGVAISCFIIQKTSLATLYEWIKHLYTTKHKAKQAFIYLLKALLNGLREGERVLIYDKTTDNIFSISGISEDRIREFVDTFDLNYKIKSIFINRKNDDLYSIYNKLKNNKKFNDMKFYYTIYDDNTNCIPSDISNLVEFCKKSDRAAPCCITREFLVKLNISHDKRFKDLYNYIGFN